MEARGAVTMKHLYDRLRPCAKEEEVKAEFCKFFKMKIFALSMERCER